MIEMDEIRRAFEGAFNGDTKQLHWEKAHTLCQGMNWQLGVELDYHGAFLRFSNLHTETLVMNLPMLCKMLIDATAEIERLKDTLRVTKKEKPIVGLRVRYAGEIWNVSGISSYPLDTYLVRENPNNPFCPFSDYVSWELCEVIE